MILRYIKVKNFRPYYDEQIIRFATDEHSNVTVIRGVNGTGKTSLLTALNWCLYGNTFFKESIGEFVNRHALANAENVETSVEIGFIEQETEYRAERKLQWLRNDKTTFSLEGENRPPDVDSAASEKIRSIIPEAVSTHFFFDGKKIDNFAKEGNEGEIKSAVHNVLKIEVFDRGITHLEKVAQDYQTQLKKYAPDKLKVLINEQEEKLKVKDNLCKEMKVKQDGFKKAKKQKRDIDTWLEEFEETRRLFEEQKEITEELKRLTGEKERIQDKIRRIANDGFIPLAKPALNKALEILQKNKTPIEIPEAALNNLLEQMLCLCGRPIHNESSEYRNIQNLITQTVSPEFGAAIRETENSLKRLLENQIKNIPANLKSALSADQQLEKRIEANEARSDEIKSSLENFDNDDFRNYKNAQEKCARDLGFLEGEMDQLKKQIQETTAQIDELNQKIKSEKTAEVKAERLKRCWELAKESASAMKELYIPLEKDMQKDLETEASEIFKKLVWKEKSFREIRLSRNYQLQVIDRYDGQVSSEISAGEREVLSLAFITALAKVAVKEKLPEMQAERFPIVMDAPFTNLSDEPKENVTATIPDIADQLILFVTDQELRNNERAWKNLEPRIGAEYELDFDDETGITTIKQIK